MPTACAHCGSVNADGNAYCQACGAQLGQTSGAVATAAPPVGFPGPPPGPPPGVSAPVFTPGGYQSPFYVPTGPNVPVHRTPWALIAGGVGALVVLMGGCGTALAILGNHTTVTVSGGVGSQIPSPSPGLIPSPVAAPVATTGGTESNAGVVVPVPPGWTVESKDSETIILTDPDTTGSVTIASGGSNPAQTAQDNKNTIDAYFKSNYPDAHNCPNTTVANSTFNGANGISWTLCLTVTASGRSVAAAASLFAGANPSGNVYYIVMVVTQQNNLQNYLNTAKPVLQGIHWKLS